MSSSDRRPHETATVLNQQLLDFSQDNLENKLNLIATIERSQAEETRYTTTFATGTPGIATATYHRFIEAQAIIFETTGTLPTGLTAATTYYVTNPSDSTFEIEATVGGGSIPITDTGSGTHSASATPGIIRLSDRNLFVGERFYEARTKIPVITRTVGEWLRPQIEFSSLQLSINNVDQRFSGMLPGGSNYTGQINKEVIVKLGLRDVEASYFTIFNGFVSETGGFKRDTSAVRYVARDKFDRLNIDFPTDAFNDTDYPKISSDVLGLAKPIIYGDYTTVVETEGNIPGQIVNKGDPEIYFEKDLPVDIANGSPSVVTLENHLFDADDIIRFTTAGTLPSPLTIGVDYYVQPITSNTFGVSSTPGGGGLTTTGGSGQHNVQAQTLRNIDIVIAGNVLKEFKQFDVWLARSDIFYKINNSDVTNIDGDLNRFEIIQNSGNTIVDGGNLTFSDADVFLVKVKGKDLGSYDDNPVSQAKDILKDFASLSDSDFDANWDTFRDKATPARSAISLIKSRVWQQEKISVLEYALSLLEQVRLEFFIDRNQKIKINSLHIEDFEVDPSHILRNFDVVEGSISVSIDEKNNFNRAQGFYDFNPFIGESNKLTNVFKNQASIDQKNKQIFKSIEIPNLYVASDVEFQVQEILRLSSADTEIIEIETTARQVLLDIGDFVKVNIAIDSTIYDNIPMLIREIGYSSDLKIPLKLWSMQMVPFANPSGWNPGYSGIVGGDAAIITQE